MGLKKDIQDTKKVLKNYWVDELSYRLLLCLSIGSILIVLFIFSSLIGDLVKGKTVASALKPITISFVITLFTFTISNTFPTVYESYKLDIIKSKEQVLVAINKRKLTVVGNVLNTIILISIIVSLFALQNISPVYIATVLILCLCLFIFLCILSWNHGKRKRAEKQNQEKQQDI